MIRTESEYQEARKRIDHDQETAKVQRQSLESAGLTEAQLDRAMAPIYSFQAQLEEEVRWYERIRRRDFPSICRLSELGRLLIALRISNGLTQRELASRLGVPEASVSRDERNEYHNITLDRAQRILDALGERVVIDVMEPTSPPETVAA